MEMPVLSLIIATRDRCDSLKTCIDSLFKQTLPASCFELIVVVDGLDQQDTVRFLEKIQPPFKLRVVEQSQSGKSAALNRGIAQAQSGYVVFTDDDVVASPEFLSAHLDMQIAKNGIVGIGHIQQKKKARPDWYVRQHEEGWDRWYTELASRQLGWESVFGGNLSVPLDAISKTGGFDTGFSKSEDAEMGYRLQQAGLEFAYIPKASIVHSDSKTYKDLVIENYNQGSAYVQIAEKHPRLLRDLSGVLHAGSPIATYILFFLLVLNPSKRCLGAFHFLAIGQKMRSKYYGLVYRYFFLFGIKDALLATPQKNWFGVLLGIPILMYHAFSDEPEGNSRFIICRKKFDRQMKWLRDHKYNVITVSEYMDLRNCGKAPEKRTIVLTIDDGYRDTLKIAAPILKKYGFRATIFVTTGYIGKQNTWDHEGKLANRCLLSWDEVRHLSELGMEIGSHSVSHPFFTEISADEARSELLNANRDIERNLAYKASTFAYPYGDHDERCESLLEETGYIAGCTLIEGLSRYDTPQHALPRTEIWGTNPFIVFFLKVSFGSSTRVVKELLRSFFKKKSG